MLNDLPPTQLQETGRGTRNEDIKKSYALYKNKRKVLWHGKIPSKIRSYEVMAPMRITGRDHG